MTEIQGKGPSQPNERQIFESQFKRAANLFDDALSNYHDIQNANDPINYEKKKMFKDVMDKTMHVMDETSIQIMKKKIEEKEKELKNDYADLIASENEDTFQKVKGDIQEIKKML